MNANYYSCYAPTASDYQALADLLFPEEAINERFRGEERFKGAYEFEAPFDIPTIIFDNIETTTYKGEEIPVFEIIGTIPNKGETVSEKKESFDVGNAGYSKKETADNNITIEEDIFYLEDYIQQIKEKEFVYMDVNSTPAIVEELEESIDNTETVEFSPTDLPSDAITCENAPVETPPYIRWHQQPKQPQGIISALLFNTEQGLRPETLKQQTTPPRKIQHTNEYPFKRQPQEKKLILRINTKQGAISVSNYPIVYKQNRELTIGAQINVDIVKLMQGIEDRTMFEDLSRLAEEYGILLITKTFKIAGIDPRDQLYYIEPDFGNIYERHAQEAYN